MTVDDDAQQKPTERSASWGERFVAEYEKRVEPFTGSFVQEMLQPFIVNDKLRKPKLLDVGCGTGSMSLYATQQGFQVTATDVSEAMVERLQQRSKEVLFGETTTDDSAPTIECVVADGQNLSQSFDENLFDYAVASFSLIFFPDPLQGLEGIYHCLQPATGRVVLSAWGSPEETPAFRIFPDAVRHVAPHLTDNTKPKRITGSTDSLRTLLEQAGFVNVHVVGPVERMLTVASAQAYYDRFALGSPNVQATIAKMTPDEQARLHQKVLELATSRGGNDEDGTIRIPSMAYFAYGTKPPPPKI